MLDLLWYVCVGLLLIALTGFMTTMIVSLAALAWFEAKFRFHTRVCSFNNSSMSNGE